MIDIVNILKELPKSTKIYSPMFGEATFSFENDGIEVKAIDCEASLWFDRYGRYTSNGKCLLFPSEEMQDWSTLKTPCQYKPFDKVIGRTPGYWIADFFSNYEEDDIYPYKCIARNYKEILPYNEETAKLLGTLDNYRG